MKYEWDENKCMANIAKHGVDFISAEEFDWFTAIEVFDDRKDYGEDRWISLGLIKNRLHVLIYTVKLDAIRIISLRKANKRERAFYEAKTK
jgi:uncharacterized DUF497 family protein